MYSPAAILYALVKLGRSAKTLGHGSLALGLPFVLIAIAGLAYGARARWHRLPDRFERTRTAVLVGAALVTPAWYLVFLNHTIVHATFMIRSLVAFIAIGVWLGWTEIAQARSERRRGIASTKCEARSGAG
jgi:amino acid transporter